jgi:CheY-like chemotaxis protein
MSAVRVLVVDDNALNVRLACFVLDSAGMLVESAACAAEAVQKLAAFEPDLILMDVQMPNGDGLGLTRALKADPANAHLRIVAFTAYAMKGDEAKFLSAGCAAISPSRSMSRRLRRKCVRC